MAHDHHHNHDKHAGHSPDVFRRKFWLSLALTLPTLAFSHTVLAWFGSPWDFPGMHYIPAILGLIVFFYGGLVFIKSALVELRAKTPGMMTLISLAILVALLYSSLATLGIVDGMDFWWELTTLITIMLLGHWIEMRSIQNAEGALNELAKLLPDEAERIKGNETETIPVSSLHLGDHVLVRPGSTIPADGVVIKGTSSVNEALLTGESTPVEKAVDSKLIAGSVNGSGSLTIAVSSLSDETVLAGIMKLVSDAQANKSHTQVLADKIAGYLTYVAIAIALITALAWFIAGESAGFILERVVTVLVVACPHALGLAIPLVVSISTTLAAKRGLLIRKRKALEDARNIDVVLFDKTGTLTKGEQGVVDIITDGDKDELSQLAAAVESDSEHSIARAIVENATDIPTATDFTSMAGKGVSATINGQRVAVGNAKLIEELSLTLSDELQQAASSQTGKTAVYVAIDGIVKGIITLADVIRPESQQAVDDLHAAGKRVAIVTGDSETVAGWVAEELGISEVFANVLPEEKAAIVKKLQTDGSIVAMVGDGVNDAPALTQADIGIAIGAGTDVAIEAADIVLAANDPRAIARIVTLSRASYRKMQQNLAWASGYNAVALPLAAGVAAPFGFILSPAIGAVLMSLSTIIVAINAQLLRRQ